MKKELPVLVLVFVLGVMLPLTLATISITPSTPVHTHNDAGQGGKLTRTALTTATGSAALPCAVSVGVTMNEYTFHPYGANDGTCDGIHYFGLGNQADDGSTTGNNVMVENGSLGNAVIRWRYITASDTPEVWVIPDASGNILASWTSDDGIGKVPLTCASCLPALKVNLNDFNTLTIPKATKDLAKEEIQKKGYKLANLPYRQLQKYTQDEAPANWIRKNMKVTEGHLFCKTSC